MKQSVGIISQLGINWASISLFVVLNLPGLSQPVFEQVRPGVPFVLRNAVTPEKHQIETMPGGLAVIDFDRDGKPDLFFPNGAPQPSLRKDSALWSNRLYRNLGNWQFEDVTGKAGLAGDGYGMGAATADFDGDGFPDLVVTEVGFTRLYRNGRNGTFQDVTTQAGLAKGGWPLSAGWFDYDNDGDLDLFVVHYCQWNPAVEPYCGDRRPGYRTYCHPKEYGGLPNVLYRNNGDGTFTDVSVESGISAHVGKGMGLAFADFNNDGKLDVFVTNDTVPNFLFRNEGFGKFREVALAAGVAIPDDGRTLSSMGSEFRDVTGDGKPDVFVTALANESFPLFRNLGNGLFQDTTARSRLAAATLQYSGWGTAAFDVDLDGRKDLVTANGDVQDNTELYSSRKSKQPNLFVRNQGDGTFAVQTFGEPAQWRGLAYADFDGDGRVDLAMTRLGGEAALFRNVTRSSHHWLAVRLKGKTANRDGIGAQVTVEAGGLKQQDMVSPYSGYASSHDPTLYFGLGTAASAVLAIIWPSGKTQAMDTPAVDRYLTIEEP